MNNKRAGASAWVRACVVSLGLGLGALAAAAQTVRVSGYQVSGNTLLDPRAVDAVLMPLLGERTLAQLQHAAAAVQALYAREGWGAVVAWLPPQSGHDGLITINVVEGRISAVNVVGATRSSPDAVKAALPALRVGTTPRLRDLDAQLRIANENPARQVQVLLKPGREPGQAEADLQVQERALQQFTLGLDNTGNDRTGDYRASLGWQHASLTGRDDILGAQLQLSPTEPQRVRVLSSGYRLPLYAQRMALDAFFAYSDVDGGNTATVAGDLRFVGRGRVLGVRAAWYLPRWGDFDPRLSLALDRRAYLNRCDVEGLGPGACGPVGESVAVTPLAAEYTLQRAGERPASLSVSLHHNLGLGGSHTSAAAFEAVRPGARRSWTALRLGATLALPVADDWQLRTRVNTQWTPDALVPGEQFGMGGAQSVRGYEERELIGDLGLAASVEVLGPALLKPDAGQGLLRPVAFVDGGWARNHGDAPCVDVRSHCAAASLGVGARYALGSFSARLDLAYALKDAARTQRGDTRAHLALQLGF